MEERFDKLLIKSSLSERKDLGMAPAFNTDIVRKPDGLEPRRPISGAAGLWIIKADDYHTIE